MKTQEKSEVASKVVVAENVEFATVRSDVLAFDNLREADREQRREGALNRVEDGCAEHYTQESNATGAALHAQIAALLNFKNDQAALDPYHEIEMGTGTNPSESGGCSEPVGRIRIQDPENQGESFFMSEFADEYNLNPEPGPDGTTPRLTEFATYSRSGEVYNYMTLNDPIKKTDDYVLVINIEMKIGGQ